MKSICSIILFVGLALGYSTSYYGWAPQKEYVYNFQSQVLTGVPEIRSQYAGLRLTSTVRIQSYPDYSLRIKFENPKFLTINDELQVIDGKIQVPTHTHEEVPESIRRPLVTPFEAHIKRGVIETLFVEKNEPVVVTNLKKALLSQLQTDLSGSRRSSVQKLNHATSEYSEENSSIPLSVLSSSQGNIHNVSFFTTMEGSLHGDCETSYTVHPLPLYQARELEEQWMVQKVKLIKSLPTFQNRMTEQQILKQSKEAQLLCQGQQYYQITKTKNFDNCRQRPVFSSISGLKGSCDPSKSGCQDTMTHMSSSKYVVCGSPEQFTIRKVVTENQIAINPIGSNTEEKMKYISTISLELLKVETAGYQPFVKPTEPKIVKSLYLEYPERRTLSSTGLSESLESRAESREEKQLKSLTGFYPLQPMPELNSSPELLFPVSIPKPELYHQVSELMGKIVKESFESPESCSSSSDVAGYIMSIAKALRPLNLDELKEVQSHIMRAMESRSRESVKVATYLYYDILSMVGTNPSVVVVKELIESEEIPNEFAAQVLQQTLKNVKTPTPELLNTIFSLVKSSKTKSQQLYSVSTINFSDLIYRACINPESMVVEFPVRIYGNFCNPESQFIKEQWIPFLESQIETSIRKPTQEKVILIHALGKTGHYKAIAPLSKVIEGEISKEPLVRSMAVYNLKRIAKQYPSKVSPIILSLIDNPAENTEVRIGAVSVLPFTTPSLAELQKIALRTWFEPSKQVTSFIYSTFKSLKHTEIPELLPVRQSVQQLISLVKPVESSILFSHNYHNSKFVEFMKMVLESGIQLVNTEKSVIPSKISLSSNYISRSFKVNGLEFSLYSQGMDYVLEKLMHYTQMEPQSSPSVRAELQKLDEKLQIKKRLSLQPEAHFHMKFMGIERLLSFNSEFYLETLHKLSEQLRSDPKVFAEGLKFEYTKATKLSEIQIVAPSDSGFPIYFEKSTPLIFSVKGLFQAKNQKGAEIESASIPTFVKTKLLPVVNIKSQSILGVISPFTKQYIGTGIESSVHSAISLETKVSYNKEGQVSLSLKTPEEIIKEVEMIHFKIKPYTFKKSLETIVPASQTSESRIIESGQHMKKSEVNIGQSYLGLDIPISVESDYKILDVAYVINKMRSMPNPLIAVKTIFTPSTLRYLSVKVRFNPTTSQTKELETRFTFAHAFKSSPSENVTVRFPKVLSQSSELKKMCVENHQNEFEVTKCLEHQEGQMRSTSDVSEATRKFCEHHKSATGTPEEFELCLKSGKVCEQAKVVCLKKQSSVKICEEKKVACEVRQQNLQKAKYILRKLEKGSAITFSVEGSVNTHYERKTARIMFSAGSKSTNLMKKSYVEVDFKIPQQELYTVEAEIDTRRPEMKTKWNLEQILSDEVKLESDVYIRFGVKGQEPKRKAFVKYVLSKTESQKQSVRHSPEYIRCEQEISQGRKLSPICEKVRHQAASVDKMVLKIQAPKEMTRYSWPKYIENMVKSYFIMQLTERTYESQALSSLAENEIVIESLISRQGEEAKLKVQRPGLEWEVKDIRLPVFVKNVLPMSLRNGLTSRLVQKSTGNLSPASCKIENQFITTFDNNTFPYTLNDCEHLLVKDCSSEYPIAVTVRGSSNQKQVKIISGLTVVELKPQTGSVLSGIYINGKPRPIRSGEVYNMKSHSTGKTTLQIQSYLDGVVVIREYQTGLEVSFDGERIEVVAPQLMHSKACGICGDLNGESTADIKSPKMCIFQKPRMAAYSYMIKEKCQGVPSQDKAEYEKEERTCTKKQSIPTSLLPLSKRLVKVNSGPSGIVMKHSIEYRANGNEICFSQKVLPTCQKHSVPVMGHMSSTPYTCIGTQYLRAKHLKVKVEANEEMPELVMYPTTYNRMVEEPIGCRLPTDSEMSQLSSSSSRHYSESSSYPSSTGTEGLYDY